MASRVILVHDDMADFLLLAMAQWKEATEGDDSDLVKINRLNQLMIEDQLRGRYTLEERELILEKARALIAPA
jgi:hypothetical protein